MCAVGVSSNRKSAGQFIAIAAVMGVSYLCIRTLRFTHEGLNLIFFCAFLLTPFLAIRPVLRLGRWPKLLGTIFLTPLLLLSLLLLLFSAACGNFGRHPELVRDLSTVQQGRYSVHLVRDATGGALGPHGLSVEQRMTVAPGLYLVKYLDFLDGAYEGSLSAEASGKVGVHISKGMPLGRWEHGGDKVYSLKPCVYF
jgi:hypothetical protein